MAESDETNNFSAVFTWSDLTVKTKDSHLGPGREVLKNCSGIARPGEFLAVMGPSGAGKTTLLNALSERQQEGLDRVSGKICINGHPIDTVEFSSIIGFVPQDDILFTSMTPREIFRFSADLTRNLDKKHIDKLVEETIDDLGLKSCADTIVGGGHIKGLSGGEKKRTSIGMELICNPCVLFLDEPTTGLDSFIALHVIEILHKIAVVRKRTVISTIHQPNSQIFKTFDKLLLIHQGSTLYLGPASESVEYFAKLGYPVRENYNPTDHYLSLMSENKIGTDVFQQEKYDVTPDDQKFIEPYHAPFHSKLIHLLWRCMLEQYRNPLNLAGRIPNTIITTLVFYAVFWNLGEDQEGVLDRTSACFFLLFTLLLIGNLAVVVTYQMQKLVFRREYAHNRYGAFEYFLAYDIMLMMFQLTFDIIFVLLVYIPLDLNGNGVWKTIWVVVLGGFTATGWGLAIAIVSESLQLACAISFIYIYLIFVCSGFSANYDDIPDWFVIKYATPLFFNFQALVRAQLEDLDGVGTLGEEKIDSLNLPNSFAGAVWISFGAIFAVRAFDFLLILFLNRKSKR
jgi:ATP-binding cassette, subfamily G (WHITE), eye pigment precursor transporter